MTLMNRREIVAGIGLSMATGTVARAQPTFPSKPIRLVVPYATGGGTDTAARIVMSEVEKKLGQPVIVENVGGAAGRIGLADVQRRAPDGYNLVIISGALAIHQAMDRNISFDLTKDFEPISFVSATPYTFLVGAGSKHATMADFIKYAADNPGKVTLGTSAYGGSAHLFCEMINMKAGLQIRAVPYNGSATLYTAVMSGDVDSGIGVLSNSRPLVGTGQMRCLAISGEKRTDLLPDVPTFRELGYEGYETVEFNALLAPAGTPASIIETLRNATVEVLESPEVSKRFADIGLDPVIDTPEALRAKLADDIVKWREVIVGQGIKMQ